jgi:hypothetical protein
MTATLTALLSPVRATGSSGPAIELGPSSSGSSGLVIRNTFSPYLVVPLKTALILSRLRPRYQSERIFIQSKGSPGGQEVEIAYGAGG